MREGILIKKRITSVFLIVLLSFMFFVVSPQKSFAKKKEKAAKICSPIVLMIGLV